jgi:hypothetical protein
LLYGRPVSAVFPAAAKRDDAYTAKLNTAETGRPQRIARAALTAAYGHVGIQAMKNIRSLMKLLSRTGIATVVALVLFCWGRALLADQETTPKPVADEEMAGPFAPDQTKLPVAPPDDAIVLFDGQDTNLFLSMKGGDIDWPIEDGALVSSRGKGRSNHLVSKLHFRDAEIHVEFMLPEKTSGNSGVYIHGNYELQIFNSSGKDKPGSGDAGAIYGFSKPLVAACRKPGEWQVYDIRYRAPRRNEDGEIVENGSITAWLNGQKVQDNATFGEPRSRYHPYRYGTTEYLQEIWKRQKKTMTGPVFLQDHDSPVRFRNVWVRPLDDQAFVYVADSCR